MKFIKKFLKFVNNLLKKKVPFKHIYRKKKVKKKKKRNYNILNKVNIKNIIEIKPSKQ